MTYLHISRLIYSYIVLHIYLNLTRTKCTSPRYLVIEHNQQTLPMRERTNIEHQAEHTRTYIYTYNDFNRNTMFTLLCIDGDVSLKIHLGQYVKYGCLFINMYITKYMITHIYTYIFTTINKQCIYIHV